MTQQTANNSNTGQGTLFSMSALTSLFFLWGFITAMNDLLIPHLKGVFDLSYTKAMLVQFCFFGAYFLVSLPAGNLVKRYGYQKGLAMGLATAAMGCLLFIPAATYLQYWMFLGALFILASGITILQVAANPMVTVIGPSESASSRLTFTQAFNSLGTTVAPIIGAYLLFEGASHSAQSPDASSVIVPYVFLAAALFALAILFAKLTLPVPQIEESTSQNISANNSVLSHPALVLGVIGIFVYVGAEVAIGSFLVNFLGEAHIAGFSEQQAAKYVSYYWGGAMVGRFIGAALMQYVKPGKLLAVNAAGSVILLAVVTQASGAIAMWAVLAVGLCNSIMFPTIFSLALKGLGPLTSKGSGALCLAIVGGALVPLAQGALADAIGLQASFFLPLICYLYIIFYGLVGAQMVRGDNTQLSEVS